MKSGKTLWDGICEKYHQGARRRRRCRRRGSRWRARSIRRRHKEVADRLAIQVADAAKWRDQILQYFQQFSKRPIVGS